GFSVTQQIARHDYYLITTPSTWLNALLYCKTNHMDLAFVESKDDWVRLNAEAERKGLPTTGWIGLNDEVNSWRWSYPVVFNTGLAKWGDGQPDNAGGNELCVAINSSGYWEDYNCTYLKKSFICYNATSGGFFAGPNQTDWFGSLSYCQTHNTTLALTTNETQSNELLQLVSVLGTTWIGLIRNHWYWSNGWGFSNRWWGPGHPNNVDHNDNCGSVNNSLVMDRPCDSLFYFFCYTDLTVRRQTVKLRFQGDKSVFDPAVQSAVLQK
ncbi:macrophage mannose receptor 1-like isoform X6, partial [Clarias magur]